MRAREKSPSSPLISPYFRVSSHLDSQNDHLGRSGSSAFLDGSTLTLLPQTKSWPPSYLVTEGTWHCGYISPLNFVQGAFTATHGPNLSFHIRENQRPQRLGIHFGKHIAKFRHTLGEAVSQLSSFIEKEAEPQGDYRKFLLSSHNKWKSQDSHQRRESGPHSSLLWESSSWVHASETPCRSGSGRDEDTTPPQVSFQRALRQSVDGEHLHTQGVERVNGTKRAYDAVICVWEDDPGDF